MAIRDLAQSVIVLTGASSGFGKGAALEFARAGAKVVLAARRDDVLDEVANECSAEGGDALACPTDVSKKEQVERLCATALETFGRIDVWVNNAGVGAIGRFERVPLEVHQQVIATNLYGTLYGSYYAYRQFLAQGHGVLINIASELGFGTVSYHSSYAAAKHGVVGFTDSLRQEVKQNRIEDVHICTIMPTAHDTPFFDHVANYTGHEVTPPQPLHDPQRVVDAIVRIARDPEDKEVVGADGVVKLLLANVMPGVSEMGARQMHETQMEKPPRTTDSPGAVRAPMRKGTGVSAGRRD
jgi:NAD(P)-dependent dehydrogenase (short-subunit alcohol dehydrogenase family)